MGQFNCDVCSKPFKRKEHLFQHRKLHTGERPYVCTSCAKAFSRKEHLVRHLVSHTGQKMHDCEACGKSFSRKDNLAKHRRTHGFYFIYIFRLCFQEFMTKIQFFFYLEKYSRKLYYQNSLIFLFLIIFKSCKFLLYSALNTGNNYCEPVSHFSRFSF